MNLAFKKFKGSKTKIKKLATYSSLKLFHVKDDVKKKEQDHGYFLC